MWMRNRSRAYAVAAVIVALIALALLAFIALAVCSGPPVGKELARHRYQGESYALVKYGDDLAIFAGTGKPVKDSKLAEDVLTSYAWRTELDTFNQDTLSEVSQRVRALDRSLSGTRRFSDDVVDIFDEIDSLGVDIPIIGRVSAMDVIGESFQSVGDAESAIRAVSTELNDLNDNGRGLAKASRRIAESDPSEVSGEELNDLFFGASDASRNLADSARNAKRSVAGVQKTVEGFEGALKEASNTPIIGDALYEFAQTVDDLESELSALAGMLADFETDLGSLEVQLQRTPLSVQKAQKDYMKVWLQEPHDGQWPPNDPKR